MQTQQFINALKNNIGIVKYNSENKIHSKFFTFNLVCGEQTNNASVTVFNLISENYEQINPLNVVYVSCGNMEDSSNLWASFLKSKEKFTTLNINIANLPLEREIILTNLTNQVDMIFNNGVSIEVFLSFLEIQTQVFGIYTNLTNIIKDTSTLPLLEFVLSHLFGIAELTFDKFKQGYSRLLKNTGNVELKRIASECNLLVSNFPQIHPNELSVIEPTLIYLIEKSIANFNKIKYTKISNNWSKLVKISYNCWPRLLQPNPFKQLICL